MEPANVLLVRVGKRVDLHNIERFRRYLLPSSFLLQGMAAILKTQA